MIKYKIIPCILKRDAIERSIVDDVVLYLKKHYFVQKLGVLTLSNNDVITYKANEWLCDNIGKPAGYFKQCILEYEASNTVALKLFVPEETSFTELKILKGTHFLPYRCDPNSVRGHFKDETQKDRIVVIDGRTFECLPNGSIGYPRNIIHVPDSQESVHLLQRMFENKTIIK